MIAKINDIGYNIRFCYDDAMNSFYGINKTIYIINTPYWNVWWHTETKYNRLSLTVTKYVFTYNDEIEDVEGVTSAKRSIEYILHIDTQCI